MRCSATWHGGGYPFEGDLSLTLRAVPADAVLRRAVVTVTPRSADTARPFEERFRLDPPGAPGDLPAAEWGVQARGEAGVLEVDLGARRTLARLDWISVATKATLSVDLGGVYAELNPRGTIRTPDDDPFPVPPGTAVLPGVTVSRFRIDQAGTQPRIRAISVRTEPSNLSIRLGSFGPFWARTGPLTTAVYSPDVADVVQAFLPRAQVQNGIAVLPFVLHSDALCRLDVAIELEYVRSRSALPEGLTDLTLAYDYAAAPVRDGDLVLRLPPGATIARGDSAGAASGRFDSTRVVLDNAAETIGSLPLSSVLTLAQPVVLTEPVVASAVDLLLAATTATAQVQVLVVGDAAGKPLGPALLERPVSILLSRKAESSLTWVSATLPAQLRLDPQQPAWLVLQVSAGEAQWGTSASESAGLLASADGGFSWRAAPAPVSAGRYRLRATPQRFRMPVQLQVGAGEGAVVVPLERFEPLQRVELDLSIPEFGPAVSAAVAAAGSCPVGEHLVDGALSRWRTVGEDLGPPRWFSSSAGVSALAVASDETTAYVGVTAPTRVEALDLDCGETATITVGQGVITALAAHPDGRLLYAGVTVEDSGDSSTKKTPYLLVLDSRSGSVRGEALDMTLPNMTISPPLVDLAISPDGSMLYVARYTPSQALVTAYDTVLLEQVALLAAEPGAPGAKAPSDLLAKALQAELHFDEISEPLVLAVAPLATGPADLVLAILSQGPATYRIPSLPNLPTNPAEGVPQLLFTNRELIWSEPAVAMPGSGVDVALLPDGSGAVVVSRLTDSDPGELSVVYPATGTIQPSLPLPAPPVAVAVRSDGARAYVAAEDGTLSTVDLADSAVRGSPLQLNLRTATALAALPTRDALCIAGQPNPQGSEPQPVAVVPIGTPVLQEWTLTVGTAQPVCLPSYGRAVVLGEPVPSEAGPPLVWTGLSQVVAVQGGCSLELSFDAVCVDGNCRAELRWLAPGCTVERTDTVGLAALDGESANMRLRRHRAQLTAPPAAVQAELRFCVPPRARALIAEVSLTGVSGAVHDADLQMVRQSGSATAGTDDPAPGWIVTPPGATLGLDTSTDGLGTAVTGAGTGPQTAALEQVVQAVPGGCAQLRWQAHVLVGSGAVLRMDWLGADALALPDPFVLTLTALDFDLSTAEMAVPEAAVLARIRLEVPGGVTIVVRRIELSMPRPVSVPLQFRSQAPGELVVTAAEVRYDVRPMPAPPIPPSGLCPATSPGQAGPGPGSGSGGNGSPDGNGTGNGHCPRCGADAALAPAVPIRSAEERAAVPGSCQSCGATLVPAGGPAAPARAQAPAPSIGVVPARVPVPSEHALPVVPGIGPKRMGVLVRHGLASAERVAELGVDGLRQVLVGLPRSVATAVVQQANQVLAADEGSASEA